MRRSKPSMPPVDILLDCGWFWGIRISGPPARKLSGEAGAAAAEDPFLKRSASASYFIIHSSSGPLSASQPIAANCEPSETPQNFLFSMSMSPRFGGLSTQDRTGKLGIDRSKLCGVEVEEADQVQKLSSAELSVDHADPGCADEVDPEEVDAATATCLGCSLGDANPKHGLLSKLTSTEEYPSTVSLQFAQHKSGYIPAFTDFSGGSLAVRLPPILQPLVLCGEYRGSIASAVSAGGRTVSFGSVGKTAISAEIPTGCQSSGSGASATMLQSVADLEAMMGVTLPNDSCMHKLFEATSRPARESGILTSQ